MVFNNELYLYCVIKFEWPVKETQKVTKGNPITFRVISKKDRNIQSMPMLVMINFIFNTYVTFVK